MRSYTNPGLALALTCLLLSPPLLAGSAALKLSAAAVTPGARQKLTVSFGQTGVYDVYLILSGPGGKFNCLKPDGSFAGPRRALPFLKALKVRQAGDLALYTWRVVDLPPATYRWSVVLTRPGARLLDKAGRLGLDTCAFKVKKESSSWFFSELREPGAGGAGRFAARGRPVMAMRRRKGALPAAGALAVRARDSADRDEKEDTRAWDAGTIAAAPGKDRAPGAVRNALRAYKATAGSAPAEKKMCKLAGNAAAGRRQTAQPLTAGASDDNKDFELFLNFLRQRNRPQVMAMDVSQRRFITVLDSHGRHVPNADVEVYAGNRLVYTGRTYANGQTLFCPSAVADLDGRQCFNVVVRKGVLEARYQFTMEVTHDPQLRNLFDLESLPRPAPAADLPHPVIPVLRAGLNAKDHVAVAEAARRAAAVDEAQAPTVRHLDWLEDTGGNSDEEQPEPEMEREPAPQARGDWILRLPAQVLPRRPHLDLVFQVDTTGSMRDEIRSIQATLDSVAARIAAMDPRPLVRWGLVLYGDKGDAYTVRRYALTADTAAFRQRVMSIQMTGGGDEPEAALAGLHAAVNQMEWNPGDAVRLVFLVADAPPHLDYGRPYTYLDMMREAIGKAIKIYPVAASGLNKQGEYIFRQWAQASMAEFLFITYGAGTRAGGPAGKTPHEVRQPDKRNNLDDIIVRTVAKELAQWRKPVFYGAGTPTDEHHEVALPPDEEGLF